jgi:hypothetical protein
MAVRLRAHHLLCMLTFVGRGYTPAFSANYERIIARLNVGEPVELVEGPDDVCAPMLKERGSHCRTESVAQRDAKASAALAQRLGLVLEQGRRIVLTAETLAQMRAAYAEGAVRAACTGCEWAPFCTDITGQGFEGTRLSGVRINPPTGSGSPD